MRAKTKLQTEATNESDRIKLLAAAMAIGVDQSLGRARCDGHCRDEMRSGGGGGVR